MGKYIILLLVLTSCSIPKEVPTATPTVQYSRVYKDGHSYLLKLGDGRIRVAHLYGLCKHPHNEKKQDDASR